MDRRVVPAPPGLFSSPLLLPAAAFYTLAALIGPMCIASLFLPGSISALTEDLVRGGITDASSIRTWTVIHIGLMAGGFFWALSMALCLIRELRGSAGKGLSLLHTLSLRMLQAVRFTSVCALIVGIWRLVRYLWICLFQDAGIYMAYVMLVPEGVMIAQAVGMYALLTRFLDSICDGAASMAYSRICGKIDHYTIPSFCSIGCTGLAAISLYLALERMGTVTIVRDYDGDYYSLLIASHPVLLLSAAMFALSALGNLLMGIYLRRYKRDAERLLFRSMRNQLHET